MMLILGMEKELADYQIQHLPPVPERKSNMPKPVQIKQKHHYEYNGDKRTHAGPIKVKGVRQTFVQK